MNNQQNDIRSTLKAEIQTLTDKQAAYVLYRLGLMKEAFSSSEQTVSSR